MLIYVIRSANASRHIVVIGYKKCLNARDSPLNLPYNLLKASFLLWTTCEHEDVVLCTSFV
jgi:hypothetical protein